MRACQLQKEIREAGLIDRLSSTTRLESFIKSRKYNTQNKLEVLREVTLRHPELKEDVNRLINQLMNRRSISTPDKVKIKLSDTSVSSEKAFKISIYTPSAFFPGISGELSSRLYKEIEADFQRCLIFDENGGIVLNAEDLSLALNAYKEKLESILRERFGLNVQAYTLSDRKDSETIYDLHSKVMQNAAEFLSKYIKDHRGTVNERMESGLRDRFFKYLKAFVVLSNFDDLIEHMTFGLVLINAQHKGDFMYQDSDKYQLKDDTIYEHSFMDGNMESNGDHTTPNLLKIVFGQIPISNSGDHLTSLDLRQLVEFINHAYHDEELTEEEQSLYDTLYNSRNFDELWDALIRILGSVRMKKNFTETKANAVIDWFSNYSEKYSAKRPSHLSEFRDFENKRNLMTAFVHTITSQRNAVFIATTTEGNKVNTSVDRSTSKKQIYDAIKSQARENYKRGKRYLYSPIFQINPGKSVQAIDDIFSQKAKNNLTQILGLPFGRDMLEVIAQDTNLELLGEMLSKVQQAFNTYMYSPTLNDKELETALDAFIDYLKNSEQCIAFTNILVLQQTSQIKKVYDLNNNALPGESIYATLTDFERNKSEFIKKFVKDPNNPGESTGNILCDHSELTRTRKNSNRKNGFVCHTCFRSDVRVDDGKKSLILPHVLLEPDELMTVGLGYDWFRSVLKENQMIIQTEAYSDKPRVILHAYNFAPAEGDTDGFYAHSSDELKEMWESQYKSYYAAIERDICNHWRIIAKRNFSSLSDILEYLKEEKLTRSGLHNKIKEAQEKNPGFNFIESYDYILDKKNSTDEKDLVVSLNNSLVYKVAQVNNLDEELNYGFELFIKDAEESGNIPLKGFEDYGTWDDVTKSKALKILGLNSKELESFVNSKSWNLKVNGELSPTHKKVLEKYYITRALFLDADLQLGIRSPWAHIGKKNSNLKYLDLISVLNNPKGNFELIQKIRKEDYSARLVAGKKRNSSGVATYTPLAQGLRFGVPKRMKVIMAEFPREHVENHFGIDDDMKPHDGASFVSGIYSIFEEASYPCHEFLGTRKTIGLIPHFGAFTQVKHAENTLTNELMRQMAIRDAANEFNPLNLNRIAYEGCKLNKRFIYNWKTYRDRFEFDNPSFEFNGRIATLQDIQINDSGEFLFTWTYDDSGEEVPRELINQMIGAPVDPDSKFVQIDNLYQLWNAFGGLNSMSPNKYGRKALSEISNVICAQLISLYDVHPTMFNTGDSTGFEDETSMKELMVAKIIDPESCKSGLIAVNTAEQLQKRDVTFGYLDTARWGIQLDYTHESLDAKIPALTQVITAIAFNGNNVELVSNLYDALGSLIKKSLEPLLAKSENPKQLNIYLAKKLQKSLLKNSIASSAMEIVMDFLEEITSDKNAPATFSYSNKDIFYKVSSDLVSNLNKDTIKQQFDGIPVIQCPSLGIIMLYEDHNGNMYTRTDLVKKAKSTLKIDDNTHLYTDDEYLRMYFDFDATQGESSLFGNIEITSQNLDIINIGDHLIKDDGTETIVKDPSVLRKCYKEVKSGIKYTKNFAVQRDLGVSKITWTEQDGSKNNLFTLNSTQVLVSNKDNLLNKRWHRANLTGIADKENPYYYDTIEDFKSDKKTYISNVNHRLGQQVIPKKYTKFQEEDYSLAEIREQGEKFFEKIARQRFSINTELGENQYGIALTDGEIVCTEGDSIDNENTIIDFESSENKWYIKDVYGNKLLELPTIVENGIDITSSLFKASYYIDLNGKQVLSLAINEDLNKKGGSFDRMRWILDGKHAINAVYKGDKKLGNVLQPKMSSGLIGDRFDENMWRIAHQMYTSWQASHHTISARIPSQSFQSFLSTETVAYTENTDYNIGYMNIWEMWFQGSDFDIDKAYTLMYSLDRQGKISGNVFTDYTNYECVRESLNLPVSKYGRLGEGIDVSDLLLTDIEDEFGTVFASLDDIVEYIQNTLNADKYPLIKFCILKLNEYAKNNPITTNSDNFNSLFNKYNLEGLNSTKNRIVQGIFSQSQDLRNLEASEQPMDMAPVTGPIKKIRKDAGYDDDNLEYNEYNPYTLYRIQRANSIGKLDVGISANGIKGAGALQQYFNQLFEEEELGPNAYFADGKMDLKFNVGERQILDQSFCRLANTRISEDNYRKLWNAAHKDGEEKDPEYIFFLYLTDPNRAKMRYPESSKLARYLTNNDDNLTYRERKLKQIYEAFVEEYDGRNPLSLFELSYYGINFEDNVADYISVFISMSTDNAKELALAKIHGTPELLSIPLAMITLGVDINTVIDVCVNVLDKVHAELAQNRFVDGNKKDVLGVIKALAAPVNGEPPVLDKDTSESLAKVYRFAQELRSITSFFKVNQGVTTKYSELKTFITTLANDRLTKAEYKFGKRKNNKSLTSDQWDALAKPVDFAQLFTNKDYADSITGEYEIAKTVVNVMDVVQTSPHFSELLRSTAYVVNLLENISGKAWISEKLLGTQIEVSDNGTIELTNQDENKVDMSRFRSPEELQKIHARTLRLIDNWVTEEFLKENEQLKFSISELNKIYPDSRFADYGAHDFLRLDSEFGINNFVEFVNQTILPKLKEKFPGNFFLESLESKSLPNSDLIYYDLRFDPYAVKDNPTLGAGFNSSLAEFDLIKDIPLDIRTMNGENLTIGELFYLYGTITGRGLTTGLNTIAHNTKLNPRIFKVTTDKIYKRLDLFILNKEPNEDPKPLVNIVSTLIPYVKAVANDGEATITDLKSNKNGSFLTYNLNITSGFIPTVIKPEIQNVSLDDERNITSAIRMSCPFVNPKITIEDSVANINGKDVKVRNIKCSLSITGNNGKSVDLPERLIYSFRPKKSGNRISNSELKKILLETVLAANDAAVYILGDTIPNIEIGSVESKLSNTLISSIINEIENEDLRSRISEWILKDREMIVTEDEDSKVRNIGSKLILILNLNDFDQTLYPDDTNHNDFDQNHIKHKLMDLYLESLSPNNFTQLGKLVAILKQLYPNKLIEEDNIYIAVQEYISDLKNNKGINLEQDYIQYLQTATQTTELVKLMIKAKLFEFLYQIKNKDYYFTYISEDKRSNNLKKAGNLVKDKYGNTWLYVGLTPKKDGHAVVLINKNNKKDINEDVFRVISDEQFGDFNLTWKLTSNSDMYIGNLSKSNFNYSENSEESTLDKLSTGDLVKLPNPKTNILEEFIVVEQHLNFINDFGQNAKPELIYKIMLLNVNTGDTLVLSQDSEGKFRDLLGNGYLRNVSVTKAIKPQRSRNDIKSSILNFNNQSYGVKSFIIGQLTPGDRFKTKDGEFEFKLVLNDKFISTLTGQVIDINDIISIESSYELMDPDIELVTKSRAYYILKDTKSKSEEAEFPFSWAPELSDGYLAQSDRSNPGSLRKASDWLVLIPFKKVITNNNTVRLLPKVHFEDYNLVTDGSIKKGDIIYSEDTDSGVVQIQKVLSVNGDNVEVLVKTIFILNNTTRSESSIISTNKEALSKSQVYTKEPGRHDGDSIDKFKLSSGERAMIFLERLKKKTGMDIRFVPSDKDFIARVNGNVIEFNSNKIGTNGENVLKEAVHEFTHIVLANLRAQNPTHYARLIERIMNSSEFLNPELNSAIYSDDVLKAEEILVRKVANASKNIFGERTSPEIEDVIKLIHSAMSEFFSVPVNENEVNKSLDSLLKNASYFLDSMSYIDMNVIRAGNIKSKIMEEIINSKECH